MADRDVVISDFGGVLTTPLVDSFVALQQDTGIEAGDFGGALKLLTEREGANPLFEMECGRLAEADFLEKMSGALEERTGRPIQLHRFREVFLGTLQPNEEMIDLMRRLGRQGNRMALLTNNVKEWEATWRSMLPVDQIFELVVDSAFVGTRKPDPAIYELTLDRLGVEAERCVFVDDMEINCTAAAELGIAAVHFRETAQAVREIERLTGS